LVLFYSQVPFFEAIINSEQRNDWLLRVLNPERIKTMKKNSSSHVEKGIELMKLENTKRALVSALIEGHNTGRHVDYYNLVVSMSDGLLNIGKIKKQGCVFFITLKNTQTNEEQEIRLYFLKNESDI
jgi:hypothetical protein